VRGYRFGAFEVDLQGRELRRSGVKLKVQDQPFQVLTILLEHYPNVVTRGELQKRLWGENTFVEFDHGLNNAIGRIREALGDSAEHARFIETVPKRGYRFVAPVECIADSPPVAAAQTVAALPVPTPVDRAAAGRWSRLAVAALLAALVVAAVAAARGTRHREPAPVIYTQVTDFPDNAVEPALSPDGRMIAFVRASDIGFPTLGQVYAKLLASGDAVPLTHDALGKYGLTFTPDGARITYTGADLQHGWNTMAISPLGGEPQQLLANAAGLTWLDVHHVLFAQITSGLHMGLVTGTDSRAELKPIYLPAHERGMAHYGRPSPDRRWILVVEMAPSGDWGRCRLVPFDGTSAGSEIGPEGGCTSAGWSPDGRTMYFTAKVNGSSHVWSQELASGRLEQITFGPTEETGVAMSADGRSIFTSVGMREGGLWVHDSNGDRLLSAQGYASSLSFSHDGKQLYDLIQSLSPTPTSELWATDLATGAREPIVRDSFVTGYDVSADGSQVVFAARRPADGRSQLWLVARDHHAAPRLLSSADDDTPVFGPQGEIVFRASNGQANYLFEMKSDGSGRRKVMSSSIIALRGMSPDRQWAVAMIPVDGEAKTAVIAVPLHGGTVRRICPAICSAKWTPDGRQFYVEPIHDRARIAAVMIPVPKAEAMPWLPPSGIQSVDDSAGVPGSLVVNLPVGHEIAPGPSDDSFVYTPTVAHRNLFRIQLP
jgi:DNA-binding winged helix-turn-helix (wHTH) protein/Tol biopolymer transport system component